MQANPTPTDLQMRAGRLRLQMLLGKAVPAVAVDVCDTTGDFEALRPYLRRDNLDAVCVFSRADGRWATTVYLRHTSPGLRRTFGSPPGQPFGTAQEAEKAAARFVSMVLLVEELTAAATPIRMTPPDLAFFIHGYAVPLDAARIEAQRVYFRDTGFFDQSEPRELARASLDNLFADLFPAGFAADAMHALPKPKFDRFLKILHGAACLGIWSHPPVRDREATREEHLAWSKRRALEHVDFGELREALDRFEADLLSHPDTARNRAPDAAARLLAQGRLKTPGEVRSFIESVA